MLATLLMLVSSLTSLPTLSESGLDQLLEDSKGEVLLVNFWATWCGPCREEFPDLVKLHNQKESSGLKVVVISMDEPEDEQAAIDFLVDQRVDFPAYLRGFEDFERFVNVIDPDWSGALPATFVFDRGGEKRFRRVGKTDYEELIGEIQPLLDD